MCGILGYKLLNGDHAPEALEFFEQLLLQSQIRGKHASGVSFVMGDEEPRIYTFKQSVPASMLVQSEYWSKIKSLGCTEMIAHTRYSTSGTPTNNNNNQPISTGHVALVHNGLVSMATKAEFERQYGVQTATENDSEIILRKTLDARGRLRCECGAMESYDQREYSKDCACGGRWGQATFASKIAEALDDIHRVDPPIFACGFLDASRTVTAVRDHIRPLWLFYIKQWAMVGFCSTKDIFQRAAKKLIQDWTTVALWEATPYTVYTLCREIKQTAVKLSFDYPKDHRFERPDLIDNDILQNRKATSLGRDMKMDNADYKQGDHRLNLRESFKRYSAAAITSWEIDPNYPLMNYLFRRYELSKSQEFWACFLYGVFYHPGSVFYVMQEFPEFEKIDLGRLKRWHSQNWRQLRYNKDRKYEKGHFVEMVESYIELIGGQTPTAQEEFFNKLLTSDRPEVNFRNVEKALRKLLRFGRYSTYIYTECLARCMGMPIMADTMFLKESDSPRAGLCYALEKPDWAKATLSKEQWEELERESLAIMDEIEEEYPQAKIDMWFMESCLCAYKGFFARGRYLGYYIHRMADEILQMQDAKPLTEGIDWNVLWQFRKECLPWEYLGEYQKPPIMKIVNQWRHVLAETGFMIGMWPMIKRGILPQTPVAGVRAHAKEVGAGRS